MKQSIFLFAFAILASTSYAQDQERTLTEMSPKNSWLKAGVNAGLPIGDMGKLYNFSLGLELSGQFMRTNHFGFGLASGYTHYFGDKSNSLIKIPDMGVIPVGLMFRYYPKSEGVFLGADLGYSFLTNSTVTGGIYVRPQVGYHNRDWNFYGFYNHAFIKSPNFDIQAIGVAATYNIRFK